MSLMYLTGIELKKIRRSKILLILLAAVVILWIPSVLNAHLNFTMQNEGISPENNFLIQGFLGMAWFMFPASIVVCTVLLIQTERESRGLLKMLSLPVSPAKLSLAKLIVLLLLAAAQILMTVAGYFVSAAIASGVQGYSFMLPPLFVLREAGMMLASSVPMLAFYWALAVCVRTPVFAVGVGLASIVPSVLMINTKAWFAYPMSYPLFVITAEYGALAENMDTFQIELVPWLPTAVCITIACVIISCLNFGQAERR